MIIRIARQFGQCIRARREEFGWTQDELARRAGVSRSTVYRLEAGTTTSLYPAKLLSVLDALGLEVSVGPKPEGDWNPSMEGEGRAEADVSVQMSDGPEREPVDEEREVEEFTFADLLAMGDAYKEYAARLKARDADSLAGQEQEDWR